MFSRIISLFSHHLKDAHSVLLLFPLLFCFQDAIILLVKRSLTAHTRSSKTNLQKKKTLSLSKKV